MVGFLETICWLVTLIGCIVAAVFVLPSLMLANGSPQQAAGAAIACAFVVIPYVAARTFQEIGLALKRTT